jgi:hypothetical protein
MKIGKGLWVLLLSLPAHFSFAGIPIEQEETCPVGGEKFKIKSTLSCSNFGLRTLALRLVTSCDFVTRLPQCPGNNLPLYKDFSQQDLNEIRALMPTTAYKAAQSRSRYYLAATIEQTLSSVDEKTVFFTLQNGLWYAPEQGFSDPIYMKAYHAAATRAFTQTSIPNKSMWQAAEAFSYIHEGKRQKAHNIIGQLQAENKDGKPYLAQYLDALAFCVTAKAGEERCAPNAAFPMPEKTANSK